MHVPSAPVEAVIALSIVFVAAEILRTRQGREGITAQAPWIVAFTFGLLHGHIPAALLFFNAGVEAGQLMFVSAVLAFVALARCFLVPPPHWAVFVPPYAIGSIAMLS